MKTVASHPGAGAFRSIASIILITILVVFFLNKTDELSAEAERVAIRGTVNEINIALSLVVYQLAVENKLDRLNALDNQNPFYYLALSQKLPENYFGVVNLEADIDKNGWYYVQPKKQVVYQARDNVAHRYSLRFIYNDINGSGQFEPGQEKITNLIMQKAAN